MKIYSFYLLNKAGGLIYQFQNKYIDEQLNKLSINDYLVLAATVHGVHAISSKFKPKYIGEKKKNNCNNQFLLDKKYNDPNSNHSGLLIVETKYFILYLFQTLTGLKFIIITSIEPITNKNDNSNDLNNDLNTVSNANIKTENLNQHTVVNDIFKILYLHYSDYVMKNPFYSLEMPVKSYLFDLKINELFQNI